MGLHLLRNDVRVAILPSQVAIGFLVSWERLGLGIKGESPAQTVGNVCQVGQHGGAVAFFDRGIQDLRLPLTNGINEVGKVIAIFLPRSSGFGFLSEEYPILSIAGDFHVALRPKEQNANL